MIIGAAPIDQRTRRAVRAHPDDAADHDRMGMALEQFLDHAVEGDDRVGEQRHAGDQRRPARVGVAFGTLDPLAAGKPLGDAAMVGRQQIDAEGARAGESRISGRTAIDCHQQGRRFDRQRADRSRGEAGSLLAASDGDHADPAWQMAHRVAIDGGRDFVRVGPNRRGIDRAAGVFGKRGHGRSSGWISCAGVANYIIISIILVN